MSQRMDHGRRLWLVVLLAIATTTSDRARAYNFDDDLEDLIAEESNVDEELQLGPGHAVQLLPSDVFNDGKPFYVERDPSTGAIDFNHKKTVNQIPTDDRGGDGGGGGGGGLTALYGSKLPFGGSIKESYVSDKKDVIVHHSTPNFHDFLNLPKMYSPENFVSISSSYANLKYQGINNKGSSNHRDQTLTHIVAATSATTPASTTTHATTTTGAPAGSTKHFFNRPQYSPVGGRPAGGPTYTYPVTSGRPITTSSTTTTTTSTTTEAPITTTEAPSSTANPQKQQLFTRYPYKSTIKNKYLETSEQTRKKFFLPSTLALPGPTTTTTERAPSTPMRSSTYYSPSVRPHWPTTTSSTTTTTTTTTPAPSTTPPAHPVRFVDDSNEQQQQQQLSGGSKIKFTMPALKYEGSRPAPFRRMPTPVPNQQQQQQQQQYPSSGGQSIDLPKNPAIMSLSDIFSTLEQKKRLESQQAAENNRVETVEEEDEADQIRTTTTQTAPSIVLLDDAAYHRTTPGGSGPKIEQSIDLSDQYVRYEVHQPPPAYSGASVPMRPPPPPPPQYGQYPVQQPNGHRPQLPPVVDGSAGGQYVRYEVQPPQQMNVVKFGSVPSMNNVVISPNQHSATFVLGSHQSVGSSSSGGNSGTVGHPDGLGGGHFVGSVSQDSMQAGASAAALSAPRPSYQMGQVLDEPNEQAAIVGSASVSVQVKPQDIIKTTSVRFPSESDDQYDNAPIISGTHKSEVLPPNGHSAPIRGPDQMSVVFPPSSAASSSSSSSSSVDLETGSTLHEVSNRIVFDSPSPPAETLNRNELNIAPNPNYPADLPEQLTPPVQQSTGGPGVQRPPRPPVPSQGPPFRYSEIQRRPTYPSGGGGGERVRPTLQLPNILPQFRPNAKISHGHGPYLKEPGTYRVPATGMLVKTGPPPALRKPPGSTFRIPAPPTRIMTRLGPSSPSRLPAGGPPVASAELENRRYYRLPPQPPAMIKDRVYNIQPQRLQPPPPPPPASPAAPAASVPSPQPPPNVNGASEQPNEPLEDNEFHRNPPQILKNILRDELNQQRPKLEPVVTLQMLQSKKQSTANGPNGFQQAAGPAGETGEQAESLPFVGAASSASPQAPPPAHRSAHPMGTTQSESKDRPVYVVYPVKSTAGGVRPQHAATDALIGQQPPPMIISPGTEYQNTPFSIASHFEQEPILGAKHKNRHGAHAPKPNFPYSLEKPDPYALSQQPQQTLGDHHHQVPAQDLSDNAALASEYNLGEEPTGGLAGHHQQTHQDDQDLISSKLQRFHGLQQANGAGDSTPIAIAYTPTESPNVPDRTGGMNMRYNKPANGAGANSYPYYSVYGETQTEVSHLRIDDVDEFGNPSRRYEQSFQAPFQASISLDPVKVTNPYEGWAVVTSSPLQQLQQNANKPAAATAPVATKLVGLEPVAAALGAGELQNTIDRSDTTSTGAEDEEREQQQSAEGHQTASIVTPASFDPNSFQPELQGGFRPIYGADIKLSEQQNPDPQRSSLADLFAVDDAPTPAEQHQASEQASETERPLATKLHLVTDDSKLATGSSSSSAVKKSPEPEEHPEPAMDLDLEAFFDQFTKDYEDEDGGELDDVTMSDEANMTGGSSEQRAAIGESRSSKVAIAAAESNSSSNTEKDNPSTALEDGTTTNAVEGSSTTEATT